MKNLFFVVLAVWIISSCGSRQDKGFTITGAVAGMDTGYIYLEKTDVRPWTVIDSSRIENGKFILKGTTVLPELYALTVREKQVFVTLFVENSAIEVTVFPDSADKSVISGSATQDIYNRYLAQSAELEGRLEAAYKNWKVAKDSGDAVMMKYHDSISGGLEKEVKRQILDFAKANGNSVVAPYLVIRNSWQIELQELRDVSAAFDTSLSSSTYVKAISERIRILERVAIGQPAVQFTMNDSLGNPVALSSFAGKYLLVDFWASWCKPCRAENPNVVKAYGMFRKKGFDVLGVSLDAKRAKWTQAVKDDGLTWTQVSDLKGWGNAAGQLYGINSIPANVLLDRDQKIIAKNLKGDELISKLTELLGPPAAIARGLKK